MSSRWFSDEWQTFVCAYQFLTRIPAPRSFEYQENLVNEAARYYPLVGSLVGLAAAVLFLFSDIWLESVPALIITTAMTVYLTGAFHEDGFADLCDGLGGGATAEHSLSIMKDSRLGTYGVTGLTLMLALKIALLSAIAGASSSPWVIAVTLIVGHGLSRTSAVVVILTSDYVRADGTAKPVSAGISKNRQWIFWMLSAALTLAGFTALDVTPFAAGFGAMLLMHLYIRRLFERRLGGYTGDCLGATQQMSEVGFYLGVAACI